MSLRISFADYLEHIREQQQLLPGAIFHFDPVSQNLRLWFWPVTLYFERVTPTDFHLYRAEYDFLLPCCLCASKTHRTVYTECAIDVPLTGQYQGEYVAVCAHDQCGYLVAIERMYARRGLLLETYPLRRPGHPAPPIVWLNEHLVEGSLDEQFNSNKRALLTPRANEPLESLHHMRRHVGVMGADYHLRRYARVMGALSTIDLTGSSDGDSPIVIDLTGDSDVDGPIVIDLTGDSDGDSVASA